MLLEISERFVSLSGEAPLTGYPMYFIRFSGCNIQCSYCDTLYHNEVEMKISEKELEKDIREKVSDYPGLKVLFTGGEPLFNSREEVIYTIIKNNPDIDFFIETNGTVPVNTELPNVSHILDMKAPSSLHSDSFYLKNLKLMREKDCLKLVISKEDMAWAVEKVKWLNSGYPKVRIFISPQWDQISLEELAAMITENRLKAALSLQIHKIIWDKNKRGV